ncbi:MAG TPA: PKD domain-containing protein [Thermoanaerobaculia bacterium]
MNLLYAVSRALTALGLFGLTLLSDAAAPRVAFTVSSGTPSAGAPVQFQDTSSSSPTAWLWTFGDGTTSNLPNPTHVFPGEGFYPVTLQITDAGGSTQTTTTVEVLPPGTLRLLAQTGHPFDVTFEATDPHTGASGVGQAVPQNDVFGYFTVPAFATSGTSSHATPEVFVKMQDDRAAGMDFSVFWGGLTDLGYTLMIRDTVTGATKVKQFPSASGPACLGVDTSGFPQSAKSVHMVNVGAGSNSFQDVTSGTAKTTIQVGETVQWNWMSGPHSTTSGACTSGGGGYYGGGSDCTDTGVWDSTQHTAGYQYEHTFTTPGTYKYFCAVHGASMVGQVEVEAATETTPTVTPTAGGGGPTPTPVALAQRVLGGDAAQRPKLTPRDLQRQVPTAGPPQPTHTPTPTGGVPTATPTPTPTAPAAQTVHVTVGNDFFRDASSGNSTTTITAGTTIQWDFQGHHTTTSGPCPPCSGDGTWNSNALNSGDHFSHTFPSAGNFPYFCGIHTTMMTGTVIVNPQ